MLRQEFAQWASWRRRHKRLGARVGLLMIASAVVDVIGSVLTWLFERGSDDGDIHSLWDAFFFTTTQLLTISSQMHNPLTTGGRIVDIGLEAWGIIAISAIAGAFAAFFLDSD